MNDIFLPGMLVGVVVQTAVSDRASDDQEGGPAVSLVKWPDCKVTNVIAAVAQIAEQIRQQAVAL